MELMKHMPGIGPKQASLFLRNVGYAENLAILDVHVLRFMRYIGLLRAPEISVTTLRRYEVAEERLLAYSLGLGWPMATLDVAIWVVMRAAGRLPS
jgi:N-glycosylase/DNA lyase